jgi:NADPH:quinone reductase-like Zn-dependent oxidoreductase
VFGVTNPRFTGGYADYAIASAAMLAKKPDTLSHVDAASVPVVAVTAWQALFEQAQLSLGQSVLIHGAAGNVGAFAGSSLTRQGCGSTPPQVDGTSAMSAALVPTPRSMATPPGLRKSSPRWTR